MTRNDIIRMAREAGIVVTGEAVWKLCELVAAAEREACAEIAETPVSGEQDDITMQAKDRVAAAIRARGQA